MAEMTTITVRLRREDAERLEALAREPSTLQRQVLQGLQSECHLADQLHAGLPVGAHALQLRQQAGQRLPIEPGRLGRCASQVLTK